VSIFSRPFGLLYGSKYSYYSISDESIDTCITHPNLIRQTIFPKGKTSIGEIVASLTNSVFIDADSFHSETAKAKMKNQVPLTDTDRLPWLAVIQQEFNKWKMRKMKVVFACSALKWKYRRVISCDIKPRCVLMNEDAIQSAIMRQRNEAAGDRNANEYPIVWCLLTGKEEVIYKRVANRKE